MSVKSDRWIRRMAQEHGMVSPFSEKQVSAGVLSYEVSSYSYDLRVAEDFKIFTNVTCTIVDRKQFDEKSFVEVRSDCAIIPPNSFALGRSVERFSIPRNAIGLCVGKSTYARCGIVVNVAILQPEWRGIVTAGNFEHHTFAGEDLCQRRIMPSGVFWFR